jgi:hypothetical protein
MFKKLRDYSPGLLFLSTGAMPGIVQEAFDRAQKKGVLEKIRKNYQ